jgi:DnaK suppressor protein
MSRGRSELDAAFIEKQRRQLLRMRESLRTAARSTELDETEVNTDSNSAAREFEDEAQRLAALELDGNLVIRDAARLARVDRALQKIDDGTYGLSDISGQHIPRERLEAVPEAVDTLSEEQRRERSGAT